MHRPSIPALLAVVLLSACKGDPSVGVTPGKEPASPSASARNVPATAGAYDGFTLIELHGGGGDLAKMLAEQSGSAKAKGQKPYAYLAATWCEPCVKIKASLHDPLMAAAFRGTYIIKLDVDEWDKGLSAVGLRSGAIPAFFQLDEQGKATGRKIDGGAWGEDVPANMAPPLKAFFTG